MGNSVPAGPFVHAHVPSPSMPGIRTCVSDPLDAFCPPDEFFDELLALLHEPVAPEDLPAIKEIEVKDLGPTECSVKVILDADAIRELDLPEKTRVTAKTSDVVRIWIRLTWDKPKREITIHTNDTSTGEMHSSILVHFLADPFRIETLYILNKFNTDVSVLAWIAEHQWVRPVAAEVARRKTKIERNVDSPYGNGAMVCITEPLDGLIDFNKLFEDYLGWWKVLGQDCHVLSDSEFEVTITDPKCCGSEKKPLKKLVRHDKGAGTIIDVSSVDLRFIETIYTTIHRSPLRVELWTETGGKRVYKRLNGVLLQYNMDFVVHKQGHSLRAKVAEPDSECVLT